MKKRIKTEPLKKLKKTEVIKFNIAKVYLNWARSICPLLKLELQFRINQNNPTNKKPRIVICTFHTKAINTKRPMSIDIDELDEDYISITTRDRSPHIKIYLYKSEDQQFTTQLFDIFFYKTAFDKNSPRTKEKVISKNLFSKKMLSTLASWLVDKTVVKNKKLIA